MRIQLFTAAWLILGISQIGWSQDSPGYVDLVQSHLDKVLDRSLDVYGKDRAPLWIATIDTSSGQLPATAMPDQVRWYRQITSPNGSNLYWDQPQIVAAYLLSQLRGDDKYANGADAYTRAFIERCVSPSGLFQWGNHIYFDVLTDKVATFSGGYHECRPHTPAWETFWKHDPEATARAIRAMGLAHVKDPETGRFCRHANPKVPPGTFAEGEAANAKPFLEAGASLIESLCWLAKEEGQPQGDLAQLALKAAQYSNNQRDPNTNLIRNQPVDKRWDYYASTTEVGFWANSLLKAYEYTGIEEFRTIAVTALQNYLKYGFDEQAGKFYGRLAVKDGTPQPPEPKRGYFPPYYAEVFDIAVRPTHNYPLPMAEACLTAYEQTGDEQFKVASKRWAEQIHNSLPANEGQGAYAEDYGRAIHFLVRASNVLKQPEYREWAHQVADEAIRVLYRPDVEMFRSHPGENRCDAVDGPGILFLALIYLETGKQPTQTAFTF